MTKSIKILGLCIAIAITGLSLGNALTGHGIKGNKNLNPVVLADGTSGSGSGTDSGSGSGSGTGEGTGEGTNKKEIILGDATETESDWYYPDPINHPQKKRQTTSVSRSVTCGNNGNDQCTPGTATTTTTFCFEPN
jgi:hypothetical protein